MVTKTRQLKTSGRRVGVADGGMPMPQGHRERILKAGLALLAKCGNEGLTTRAVAEAASVQAPVIYRLFGDKTALLDAMTEYGFEVYLTKKQAPHPAGNPVEALKRGWELHIAFGLENPELYHLMYANPHTNTESSAARNLDRHRPRHRRVLRRRPRHQLHALRHGAH
jgi:AcrR family transcriptional regulator